MSLATLGMLALGGASCGDVSTAPDGSAGHGGSAGGSAGTGGATGGAGGTAAGEAGRGGSTAGTSGAGGSADATGGASGSGAAGAGGSGGGAGGSTGGGGGAGAAGSSGAAGTAGSSGAAGTGHGGASGSVGSAGSGGGAAGGGSGGTAGGGSGGAAGANGGAGGSGGSGGAGGAACSSPSTCPGADTTCQHRTCTGGLCGIAFTAAGTACTESSGNVCDGNGACVGCRTAADCPGTDTVCHKRACTNQTCGSNDPQAGTAAGGDTAGDCHKNVCDGSGHVTAAVDDTDKPVDGNACTADLCTNGVASNPANPGAICASDGSKACDATGACSPLTFRVVRIGDGSAALNNAATPVFVEERKLDGTLVGTVSLPTAASGANQPLTLSGSASSEGELTLSASGRYLVLAGYSAAPGTTGVASTSSVTVPRIVGRIDVAGIIDTSTRFPSAFDGNNARGAVSVDGSSFWVAGASGTSGGVWYSPLGATGGETRVVATPNNARWLGIFGGQLYGSSGSSGFTGVFAIGAGAPTAAGQTATPLPGLPTTGGSPYGFALFDLDANVAGVDTLYLADDVAGLTKWTFNGITWTQVMTLFSGGVRGVAGYASGGVVTLAVTTSEASANHVVVFVDDGASTPSPTMVAAAATNTLYRGVALSPHF